MASLAKKLSEALRRFAEFSVYAEHYDYTRFHALERVLAISGTHGVVGGVG